MSRILFLLVLLVVGFILLKSIQRQIDNNKDRGSRRLKHKTRFVACETCGLRVPEPDAVHYGGQHFCSLEHAQQAQSNKQLTQNKTPPNDKS